MRVLHIFLISIIPFFSVAQNFFETSFGSTNSDFARSVKQLSDGSIYIAGYSDNTTTGDFDIILSKLNGLGYLLWTRYYGDTLKNEYGLYMNICKDGNLVVAGERRILNNDIDIIIYKIDTSGNIIWERTYGTAILNESAKYIESTKDGGYILCGFRSDNYASNDIYVLKLDSLGLLQWENSFGGMDNDYANMIHQTMEGNYIITADTKSKGAGGYDIEILKLDSLGNIIWDYTYGDVLQNGCQGILITSDGKYLSYGETEIYQYSPFDFYVEKIDANGLSIWKYTYGGVNADAAFSAIENDDKSYVFTGYSNSYSAGPLDLVIFKIDSAGSLLWTRTYGGSGIDIGYDIIKSSDNGFLITGYTTANDVQIYLLHLNQEGIVSIEENYRKKDQIKIYPNPAKDILHIQNFSGQQIYFKVFTVQGKYFREGILSGNTSKLTLKELDPGTYIMEFFNENAELIDRKNFQIIH